MGDGDEFAGMAREAIRIEIDRLHGEWLCSYAALAAPASGETRAALRDNLKAIDARLARARKALAGKSAVRS